MADWAAETKTVFYSTNQGSSWRSSDFSSQAMNVSNILTELNAMSTNFVIFGTIGNKGRLYHIDLDTMGLPVCQGLHKADLEASDYETWTPSDGKSDERCLLGRQSLYTRRKQLAGCLNHKELKWPVIKKNCSCSEEDFECDAGFVRSVEHMSCLPEHQTDFYEDEDGNPGVCKDKAFVEIDAYRKVAGDSCMGGWKPEKFRLPCKELEEEAAATKERANNKLKLISWPLFIKAAAGLVLLMGLCCLWRSKKVQVCVVQTKIWVSGQRDYSSFSEPRSAADDPTHIGASSKPTEMHSVI